ncbi:hypothetical protein, partial [Mesotoga sp. UBA5847]|uniref:hypothetical protein n=1 Tax=Mesotoga sp. UBA5847 TaxID=1946859 RepID=UPI0025EC77CD
FRRTENRLHITVPATCIMELATLGLGERRTHNGQPFSYSTRNLSLATVSKIEILTSMSE